MGGVQGEWVLTGCSKFCNIASFVIFGIMSNESCKNNNFINYTFANYKNMHKLCGNVIVNLYR